jgi:drug/metabolite transporter (DMT)-like permease
LTAAVLCAVCYGVATALQARAAVAGPLIGLLRRWPFLLGLALDVAGFGAQLVALRTRPLFVVQAAQAGNLAVTAIACVPLLGIRLRPRHWAAVLAVSAGLAVLGASSGPEGATEPGTSTRLVLLGAALLLGAIALVAARLGPPAGAVVQGVVAGLGFGLTALAVRSLPGLAPGGLLRDPAAYAAAISGICAFAAFAAGLQRGQVTTVAALTILGETALPAAVGIALWGDRTRPGWAGPAVLGFVVALAGALALSRFAEPEGTGRRPLLPTPPESADRRPIPPAPPDGVVPPRAISGSAGSRPSAPPGCPPDTAPTDGPGAPAPETRRPGSA